MTNWQNIKAVAFDLDGTLVDSVPDLTAATQAILAELGLKSCTEDQVRVWVGNGAPVLLHRALTYATGAEVSEQTLAEVFPKFMRHYQNYLDKFSKLYPDVIDTLAILKNAGFQLAVVTNKPFRLTEILLKAFGIEHYFSLVLGGDSLEKMKPDPLPLEHLMIKWGLKKDNLLMVGDSRNDILAAKAAGVKSIGLTYGYNYGEDIGLCGPDAVCEQFIDILHKLNVSQPLMEQIES